ncbi:MAG TPA: cell wall-binding repeat-containing protein [Patescibacteria group bacterium]|nr:cell wall-binding repeat-containing protein [Patescibacteria group bacterium]
MPYRLRVSLITLLFSAVAVLGAPAQPAAAAGEKVAIIVGPVGSLTSSYRAWADDVADAATAAGATVVKAYSPNATWSKVKEAVAGANVIVYFGHGNGYPNPYGSNELTDRSNGWGLNRTTTNGDADSWSSTMAYCGEKALLGTLAAGDGAVQRQYCGGVGSGAIAPAANFTMIYAQAHYAPGFGERYSQTTPLTTLSEAQQRVRHYSDPILKLGGTFIATAYGDADDITARVLTQPNKAFADIFAQGRGWTPSRAVSMAHPDVSGSQVWVQRTTISGFHFGEPDFWYAFAGRTSKTPAGGTASVAVATPPTTPSWSTVAVSRLAGSDRYATAAAVSAASYPPGVPVAYVATGANFPDALAAGAAAARRGGPVLLVAGTTIPSATASELARLKPAAIKVVGGASTVSEGVLAALRGYATSGSVTRLAGADRYATAAAISRDTFATGVPVAYVATGTNFPDALAGVAAAGSGGGPVLLTDPNSLSGHTATELGRLRPGRIVVLGGSNTVSDGVLATLRGYATSGRVDRLAGANRYATAVQISSSTFATSSVAFIATGSNFPDALAGGPVAGSIPGPLLLVPGTTVPADVARELLRLAPDRVVILGGPSTVSASVQAQIGSLLGQ